jgi:central kinetochore subunit Mis15/CHL4
LDPRPSDTIPPEEHFHQDSALGKENENQEDSSTSKETEPTSHIAKKRKLAVHSRFGTSGTLSSAPLDRLDVRLLDAANDEDDEHDVDRTQPTVSLTFAGSDIVSGIRKLAELGVVEPERMPSWMTGEEAVSVAVVHRGKRIIKDG